MGSGLSEKAGSALSVFLLEAAGLFRFLPFGQSRKRRMDRDSFPDASGEETTADAGAGSVFVPARGQGGRYGFQEQQTETDPPYIPDQQKGELAGLPFGKGTMGKNGCGVAAVYNALLRLGERPSLTALTLWFERRGTAFFGLAGTIPSSIRRYFKERGFSVKEVKHPTRAQLLALEAEYPVFILLTAPGKKLFLLHYVCLFKENGGWRMLNALFPWEKRESLSETADSFNRGDAKIIRVFGIGPASEERIAGGCRRSEC